MKALDDAAGQVYDSQKVLNRIKGRLPQRILVLGFPR